MNSNDLSILFIIVAFIAFFAFECFSAISLKKELFKKYNSWNIGDRLKITLNIYDADPWTSPHISYATIIDKKNGWLKIKYDDGSGDTIEFALHNINTINTLEKV